MFLIRDGTHMKSTLREWGYVIGRCEEMLSDVMEWGVSECFGSPIFIFLLKKIAFAFWLDITLSQTLLYQWQALIKDKKRKLLQEKLSENIGKPKELWKIIRKLGLPDKKAPTTSICLNTEKELTFSPRTIANTFKKHFANFVSDLC